MKIKKLQSLLVAGCAIASLQAVAAPNVSYNYVGLQYFDQDLDDADCSQDGLTVHGSLELNDAFFALGHVTDASGNKGCGSENYSAGLGYQTLFGADSSIYGALSAERISVDQGESDTGMIVAAGIRGFVAPQLEGKVEVAHHTAYDGDTQLNAGAAYWFNPQLAATGDVSLGSEATSFAVGVRFNF